MSTIGDGDILPIYVLCNGKQMFTIVCAHNIKKIYFSSPHGMNLEDLIPLHIFNVWRWHYNTYKGTTY